jgi:exopolysaccharide biosynthesis protein
MLLQRFFNEFGNLMLSLGIYQGLNLDGGGSTTMVVDGVVVNSPSDLTGERPVAHCLVVLRKIGSNPPHAK